MASRSTPEDVRWEPMPENRKPFNIKEWPLCGAESGAFLVAAGRFAGR